MMSWSKIGAILAIPATLLAIVGGVMAFNNNYVSKDSLNSKVKNVEVQLAGALQEFREDFKDERLDRKERDFRMESQQLQYQIESYEDKLRQFEQSPSKNDNYQKKYYERQLQRSREQHERVQDALIEIQKNK